MIRVNDARGFDPRAVQIANQLGSSKISDYQMVETWLRASPQLAGLHIDTLTEVFDREHPDFAPPTQSNRPRTVP